MSLSYLNPFGSVPETAYDIRDKERIKLDPADMSENAQFWRTGRTPEQRAEDNLSVAIKQDTFGKGTGKLSAPEVSYMTIGALGGGALGNFAPTFFGFDNKVLRLLTTIIGAVGGGYLANSLIEPTQRASWRAAEDK